MSIFPVISRELRAQARQPFTYWLRVLGAAAVLLALLHTIYVHSHLAANRVDVYNKDSVAAFGTALFSALHRTIFFIIWIVAPLSMADTISRERREGTLSLLYLTKLHSVGIVVGKAFVHVLRAFSIFLTMIPWLVLPLLFGGVALHDVTLAILLTLAALLFATAAALLASTLTRDWLTSILLAGAFALVLLLAMLQLHGSVLRNTIKAHVGPGTWLAQARGWFGPANDPLAPFYGYYSRDRGIVQRTSLLLQLTGNTSLGTHQFRGPSFGGRAEIRSSWQNFASNLTPAGLQAWRKGVVGIVAVAALTLVGAIVFAACYLQCTWRDRVASPRLLQLKEKFLTPRFAVGSLRRSLASSLSANPIGWLQLYSPSARLVKWGWCLFILLAQIFLSGNPSDLYSIQSMLGVLLLVGLAFSSTGSFRSELETGAFELLLVTPIREGQIIMGRLRGIWKQFLPAILLYAAGNLYLASGWSGGSLLQDTLDALTLILLAFCTLPVVGLFFSIKRLNFFVAWTLACLVGLGPSIIGAIVGLPPHITIPVQLCVALIAGMLLFVTLRSHTFRASL